MPIKYKLIKPQAQKVQVKEFLFFLLLLSLFLQQLIWLKKINLKIQKALIHQLQVTLKNLANKKIMILHLIKKANKKKLKKIKILQKKLKKNQKKNKK